MTEVPQRALVIVAHPDDAEFGCAGTAALWTQQDSQVFYVVCTNGDKGSKDSSLVPEQLAQIREEEQRRAAATLGVKEVAFLGYPDGALENTPQLRAQLVRHIRRWRPEIVITNDPYRIYFPYISHRDHRVAGLAALDALFPEAGLPLYYPEQRQEGLAPHQTRVVYLAGTDESDLWIDISQTFDLKVQALWCHQSQFASREDLESLAKRLSSRGLFPPPGQAADPPAEPGPPVEGFRRIELAW